MPAPKLILWHGSVVFKCWPTATGRLGPGKVYANHPYSQALLAMGRSADAASDRAHCSEQRLFSLLSAHRAGMDRRGGQVPADCNDLRCSSCRGEGVGAFPASDSHQLGAEK